VVDGPPAVQPLTQSRANQDVAVFPETHSVRVRPPEMKTKSKDPKYTNHIIEFLVRTLPDVVVCGIAGITRAVINKPDTKEAAAKEGLHLVVEGNQMLRVMATPGVVGTKVVSNHVMEMERTLGIEAARCVCTVDRSGRELVLTVRIVTFLCGISPSIL
jgi:DNA-directed RNA polymerase III subunit RPC1